MTGLDAQPRARTAVPAVSFTSKAAAVFGIAIFTMSPSNGFGAEWESLGASAGVIVQVRRVETGETIVRAAVEIDVPADVVTRVLLDIERFPEWMPELMEWRILHRSAGAVFVYGRTRLPWPISDRDYLARYDWQRAPDGRFVLRGRATRKLDPGLVENVVRLRRNRCTWRVMPLGSARTRVVYTFDGDLGGDLPPSIRRAAWKRAPAALLGALRRTAIQRGRKR